MNGTIAVAGSLAQKPHHGGLAWVFLQYLLGLKRLGWEVLFIDRLEPDMCRDASGRHCSVAKSYNLEFFIKMMRRFDLDDCCALLHEHGRRATGLSRDQVIKRVRESALLINIMGFLDDKEILGCAPRRVFFDIDPGFPQMWQDLGLTNMLDGYHDHVSIGENIGRPDCRIPECGYHWITTPQPVVLDYWPVRYGDGNGPISSIVSWRGAYGPIEHGGRSYGLRAHEFRKFVTLPTLTGQHFELALDIHPQDAKDRALLTDNGWRLTDPLAAAGDPDGYRASIGRARAEFMVAKNIYVDTHSGWFSDRSICYLASGKPVIAQDTGLRERYGDGEGLLLFDNLQQAAAAVEALGGDYHRHARAARAAAEEHFDSDKVLSILLAKLGVA